MTSLLAYTLAATLTAGATASTPALAPPAPAATTATSHTLLTQAVDLAAAPNPLRPALTRQTTADDDDSLANGARIGAIVGAIAMGAVTAVMCVLVDETDGYGDCAGYTLLYGVLGAGLGAGIGAGVDALFDRPMAVVRVRF